MSLWKSTFVLLTATLSFATGCAAPSTGGSSDRQIPSPSSNSGTEIRDQSGVNDGYPDEWWKPVPKEDLASWEIGPQAADRKKGEVILSKRNELGRLSNFYAAPFTFEGRRYASVEGLWQSLKYPEGPSDERLADPQVKWFFTRDQVENMTAFEAKDAGTLASNNMKKLGIKWVTYKGQRIYYATPGAGYQQHYEVIFNATVQKVLQNADVKEVLLKTGSLNLLPDHKPEQNVGPSYAYYTIAMKIRKALQDGITPKP